MAGKRGIASLSKEHQKKLKEFGMHLRKLREGRGWVLEDVIEHGYPSWQHWQAIESGLKNFSFSTLMNIASTLKIPPKDLLKAI